MVNIGTAMRCSLIRLSLRGTGSVTPEHRNDRDAYRRAAVLPRVE
jgi:hypothetical protein